MPGEAKKNGNGVSVKGGIEVKVRWCVYVGVFLFAWLPPTGKLSAEEGTKPPDKQIVKPVKNGVRVYVGDATTRVWIGVVDKDADVEILREAGEWCQVQYTKGDTRFVGWVRREDLALPNNPPPEKKDDKAPKILSVGETSEQLRKIVRVGVDYKSSRGEGWKPEKRYGRRWTKVGRVEMKLRFDDQGKLAKMEVLSNFQKDAAIELYVENKIVELRQFQKIANPAFDRVIEWYIRALEAYNEDKIRNFESLIESADKFWKSIEKQPE